MGGDTLSAKGLEGPIHKQRIEEWLRANASAPPEEKEKMQRRLVSIIKELVTWMDELEKAMAGKKAYQHD